MPFEPQEIRWKYFYKDDDGNMHINYEAPQNKKMLAPLLLSKGSNNEFYLQTFAGIAEANFCACIPCSQNTDIARVIPNYQNGMLMENRDLFSDLLHKTDDFKVLGDGTFPLTTKQGASQAISAIYKGYDIIDFTGGVGMTQKMVLIKDYFRNAELPKKKIKFWGFSDGSTPAIYLSDILQPIISLGSATLFASHKYQNADKNFALKAMKGEVDSAERELECLNDVARAKYSPEKIGELQRPKIYSVNSQCLLHNLDSAEEFRPQEGEKIILMLEGMSQFYGYSPHEAVEKLFSKWSKLGILEQLQHLEIGEICGNSEVEQEAIKHLCDHYGVALIARKGERTGHGDHVFTDPSGVFCDITIEEGKLIQRAKFNDVTLPQKPSPKVETRTDSLEAEYKLPANLRPKLETFPYNPEINCANQIEEAVNLRVIPANEAAREMMETAPIHSRKVIGGTPYNVIDHALEGEKGLLLVVKKDQRNAVMLPLQDAWMRGRLEEGKVPFVIVASSLAENERQNFDLQNKSYVEKFAEFNEVKIPLFYVEDQVNISDDLFFAKVLLSLEKAPTLVTEASVLNPVVSQNENLHK